MPRTAQRVASLKIGGFTEMIPGKTTYEEIQPDAVL
jgi:hypothetical protein